MTRCFAIFSIFVLPFVAAAGKVEELWSNQVEPLLDKQCLKCHAGVRQKGGLDLRSLETILKGGESGPAMIPGKPDESRLVRYVLPDADPHMPSGNKKQLTSEEIAIFRTWIGQLPVPKSKLASGTSTNNTWVAEYLEAYRHAQATLGKPPAKLSASATIDWYLKTAWRKGKITPTPLCDDSTFARRVYLDVAGRIPSNDELKFFLADSHRDRRERLTGKLIDSDDYPRHMREVFDTVLMGRPARDNATKRRESGWNTFLEESFRMNRPWNDMVREIIVARGTNGLDRGACWYLAERNNSHQRMAEAIAPIAFGVQIKCAQCHNHPLAWEIEQRHYWGLVAAFNRSKKVETETGTGVAESATGGFISFANLKKESQPATLAFLNGKSVPERIPGADEKEIDSPDLYLVPPVKEGQKPHSPAVPKFSRRAAFAEAVTQDNPQLARAFVNRMWVVLMGRGIVQPADQIDSRHPASHPELLDWLTHDFEKSGYDIKRLVRSIVLSRAYQLDSKASTKAPRPESFARALEKPLSAEQLMHSLLIATGHTLTNVPVELSQAFVVAFPDLMADHYNPSLQQALFLSNSGLFDDLLKPAPGSTTTRLLALGSNDERVREGFRTVFGRLPDPVELRECLSVLDSHSPEKGVKNLQWALLTSAEFLVNH